MEHLSLDSKAVTAMAYWINERESIRIKKEAGEKAPWTKNEVLMKYRFCNVHRDDDAVTRYVKKELLPQFVESPDQWFVALAARLLNNPDSLRLVGRHLIPWAPAKFQQTLKAQAAKGKKVWNAAYIVSTNGIATNKVEYVTEKVLTPAWKARKDLHPIDGDTLDTFCRRLEKQNGIGSFIAAQVVADIRDGWPLRKSADAFTFARPGPGSKRGLNRLYGRRKGHPWGDEWHGCLMEGLAQVQPLVKKVAGPLHAQDFQNCLCEFDKFMRATSGEGTPKQLYRKGAGK